MITEEDIRVLLSNLSKTKFRGSFHLNNKMKEYAREKGYKKIYQDAKEIVIKNLSPAIIKNDGKQTTMRQTHPVFIAMHATGTCCRSCLYKIHKIKKNKELTNTEINYIVRVIMIYIENELNML